MAQLFGAKTVEVPDPGYAHDLNAMLAAVSFRTRQIFIANPNNPTGTMVHQAEIDHFMDRVPEGVLVVFDEAYYEFLDNPPDVLKFVREGRNVVVMRTFSKIQGLAGLRIGYGLASKEIADVLQKTRQPFNANSIAQAGALAGIQDDEYMQRTRELTHEGREFLQAAFSAMGLEFVPSAANFVSGAGGRRGPGLSGASSPRSDCSRDAELQAARMDPRFCWDDGSESALCRGVAAVGFRGVARTSGARGGGRLNVLAEDTIAAISTPPGEGAIGVIRISGPEAVSIAERLFRRANPAAPLRERVLHYGCFRNEEGKLDEGMAVIFRAPRSYTGEDMAEFHCHGGVLVVARILEAVLRADARAAEPGEFTRRAFVNGKMDLTQAEAVMDVIRASTPLALRAAEEQLAGRLGREVEEVQKSHSQDGCPRRGLHRFSRRGYRTAHGRKTPG